MITEYRGKDTNGNWAYGNLILVPNLEYALIISPSAVETVETYDDEDPVSFSDKETTLVKRNTVGAWTGLLDKENRKIYEGDIVTCTSILNSNIEITDIVVWNEEYCRFEPFATQDDFEYKVVGNMFDK